MATVQINMSNKMSDSSEANPEFDLTLITVTPILDAGTCVEAPQPVIASLNSINNTGGGIYQGEQVRGVVAYRLPGAAMPGANTQLFVYFDDCNCFIAALSSGTLINKNTINEVADSHQTSVTGHVDVAGKGYNYTAQAEAKTIGDNSQCIVTIFVAEE